MTFLFWMIDYNKDMIINKNMKQQFWWGNQAENSIFFSSSRTHFANSKIF